MKEYRQKMTNAGLYSILTCLYVNCYKGYLMNNINMFDYNYLQVFYLPLPLTFTFFDPSVFIFEHFHSSGSYHPVHRTDYSNHVPPWILCLTLSHSFHTLRSQFLAISSFLALLSVTVMTEEGFQGC